MKIAILSQKKTLYSTRRLIEACEARGHEPTVIDYMRCHMNITSDEPTLYYKRKKLPTFDAIIPRVAANKNFYGCAIVRQFEMMGIYTINPSIAITRSGDKLRSQQLLTMRQVETPVTGIAHSPDDIDKLIKLVGEPPMIIKLVEGTQGVGVVLAETKKAVESVIQTLMGLNANLIVQEYIKESSGSDIRCFVVGNKVVAAMRRQAGEGEFRANIHRGGNAEVIKITKAEREIAVKAAKVMGLRLAGVDILRSERGPLVLEVNSSPGLEGIEKASQIDIAGSIIEFLEKHAKPIGPKSRYEG